MIDYTYLMIARKEYEERVQKAEMEMLARQRRTTQSSAASQILYSLGLWLEGAGLRLKEQHQPVPLRQSYDGGRAA